MQYTVNGYVHEGVIIDVLTGERGVQIKLACTDDVIRLMPPVQTTVAEMLQAYEQVYIC